MRRIKAKYIIELLIHLAFWIGVYYTLNSLTSSTISVRVSQNGHILEKKAIDTLFPYSIITLIFLALLFYGNIYWIFKKALHYKNAALGITIAAGWFILLFIANYIFVGFRLNHSAQLGPPLEMLVQNDVRQGPLIQHKTSFLAIGNWFHMQLTMVLIFLAAAGLSIAYFFLKEWARNELVRNKLEAYQLSTEIKFLKSQINPHFLFNTLNNLFSMAQAKGNDDLADGISKLSDMMRYMLYDSNAGSVPLKKEIAYLEDCITLNKLRYAVNEIKVTFEYPVQSGSVAIAPMLFIPFVENAFKHGISIGHTSLIDIAIIVSGQKLIFTCVNMKYSAIKKIEDEKSGIGLENVKRRLDLLYPRKHHLQISEDDGKYIVKLEIDLE
jgi:two-component system LytT family sensor kinase